MHTPATEEASESAEARQYKKLAKWFIGISIVAVLGCAGTYLYFFHGRPRGETAEWGAFGSYFSGVAGTVLAGFTLAALALTLGLQAKELAESRALANKQSKILEKQSATMAQQAFDSVFFNLLDRFNLVRDDVTCEARRPTPDRLGDEIYVATGREALNKMYQGLAKDMQGITGPRNRLTDIQSYFDRFYLRYEPELGPYFRTLYHIFKFVHNAEQLTEQQRINYANIARAQLSSTELCIIFYDGLTTLGDKFKPLIQGYGILKHLNGTILLLESDKTDESLYLRSAFESQEEREGLEIA
jgi:hypothetical protein